MIRRGEIYWVQLDPAISTEIKKTCPALVVSNDQGNQFSSLVTVLPITSKTQKVYPFEVIAPVGAGGLKNRSKIKANQISTVDKQRLSGDPIGPRLDNALMNRVEAAIKIHLAIS